MSKPVQKYVWLPDIKVDETGVEPFGRKPNGSTGLTQKRLSLSLHVNSLTIKRGETVLITLGIGAMWDGIFRALRAVFGERGLALLAVIGISAAVTWVVYVFFSESTRYSAQKYYDLKLSLSVEAAKTAAQIATSDNADVIHAAAIRFDELYWGKLVLVEDSALEGAMVDFRQKIARPDNELDIEKLVSKQIDRNKLRDLALKISQAGFNLLQPSWLDQLKSAFRTPQKGLAQSH